PSGFLPLEPATSRRILRALLSFGDTHFVEWVRLSRRFFKCEFVPFLSPKSSNTGILETKSNKILDRASRLRLLCFRVLFWGGGFSVPRWGCCGSSRPRGGALERAVPAPVTRVDGRGALRAARRPRPGRAGPSQGSAGSSAGPFPAPRAALPCGNPGHGDRGPSYQGL
ncbi:hypothetical protein Nmel_016617, partial [Mimus melanotis]